MGSASRIYSLLILPYRSHSPREEQSLGSRARCAGGFQERRGNDHPIRGAGNASSLRQERRGTIRREARVGAYVHRPIGAPLYPHPSGFTLTRLS